MRTFTTVWWHWYNRCRKEFMAGTKAFLALLVLSSFLFTKTVEAQTCDGSYFDVDFTHSYDANTNKTTYQWVITDMGAPNAISHWGFDLNTCPPHIFTVQQFLNGAQAFVSSNGTNWQSVQYAYGEDKSQSCTSGEVFKFDEGITGGGTKYFKLVVNGPWNAGIPIVYFKYGNQCCTQAIPNTDPCLDEICFPPTANDQSLSLCESSFGSGTATFNLTSLVTAITGGTPNVTVTWFSDASLTNPIANPSAYVSGSKTVYAKVTLNRNPNCYNVADVVLTVKPLPIVTITGNNNVCPGSSNIYQATANMDTYSWSISGNGTITGATNTASVTVLAGNTCASYTLTVTVTKNGCSNTYSQTFNVTDTQAPVINATGTTLTLGCNPTEAAINAALGSATATDNCLVGSPTFSDGPITSTGCQRSQTRTWNVSDACGNAAVAVSRTVTWTVDTEAPVITATGTTLTLGCNPTAAQIEAALGTATATDNCGAVTPTATTADVVIDGCQRSQTRTWNVSDACGNAAVAVTRTVTWTVDTEIPVITVSGYTATLGCNPTSAAINAAFGTASATDNCGVGAPTFSDGPVISDGCQRSQTRTWNVSDNCGNAAVAVTRTVTWTSDTEAPVITATGTTLTLVCNPTSAQIEAALGSATATDNCGAVTPTVNTGQVIVNGCQRSQTRTWNVSDACGNAAAPVTRTVTWTVDTEAPVITVTGHTATLGCNPTSAAIHAAFGTASATDNCGNLTPTFSDGPVTADGCQRSQTRTWNVSDACGNAAVAVSRTVTWTSDTEAPVITATGTTLSLGCNPTTAQIEAALGTATATDNCGAVTPTASTGDVVVNGCQRSQTRTWNVSDACGNAAVAVSRTVTWTSDTEAPVITISGYTATLGCNPTSAAINAAFGTATATDNCGVGTPTATTADVVIDGCQRSQTRTWNVSDNCGNAAVAVTRTVTWTVDVTAPVITATGTTLTLGCNPTEAAINAALGTATATDNCGVGAPSYTDGPITSTGCQRSQTRTWNVSDNCGNAAVAVTRTVTWTSDTQAPVITATGTTLTLGCNPTPAQIESALGTASATDNCGAVTPNATTADVVIDGCQRSQTRTWNVSDACGNAATPVTRTVTWTVDTQIPVIAITGYTATLGCNPTSAAINAAFGTASATDNCGVGTPTYSDGPVTADGCQRSQTRTWNVSDACGNAAVAVSRTVTWTSDTEAPVITATGTTLTLGCNPTTEAIEAALGTATATDNCGAVTPTASTGTIVVNGCLRSQTRTWNVSDACGNSATPVTRTVTWTVDTEAPVITATGTTLALGCNPTPAQIEAALGSATATDNCGAVTPTAITGDVVVDGCQRSQIRTWNVSDACGNAAVAVSRTVTWTVDVTAPVITATGTTLTLGCNPTAAQIEAALGSATATDNCGSVTPTASTGDVVVNGCIYSQTRTWNVNDACGNAAVAVSRTVTWTVDTEAPVITATGTTLTLGCNPTAAQIEAALGTATATDNCGAVTPTASTGQVVIIGCVYTQTRTWNVSDACGNAATPVARIVTWTIDTEAPTMSATPATIEAACGTAFNDLPWQAPVWSDACGTVIPVSVVTTPSQQQAICPAVYTRTWTVRDACGNQSSFTQTITVPCCTYCTYTQGYYGNPGGKACTGEPGPDNLLSTKALIERALNSARYNGTMTIGSAGKYITISATSSDIQSVIDYLPGGGSSYAFKHNGTLSISDLGSSIYVKKKGNSSTINNTLLAQTITLGLNLGVSPGLYDLQLIPGMYLNTMESTGCGSSTEVPNSYNSYMPDQTLVNALPTKTVGGLFELANIALGGGPLPAGVNLNMIAEAVDDINNLFDECKIFKGYSASPLSNSAITFSNENRSESTMEGIPADKLQVSASPNPYNDNVRFTIESTVSGQGSLEVYNLVGQKLQTVYQGYITAGKGQTIEYKVPLVNRTTLIYVLKVGGQQVTGKLLNVR